MTNAALLPTAPVDDRAPAAAPDERARVARRTLSTALILGIAADALLRNGPGGIGFPLWITLAVLAAVALTWRLGRTVPTEAAAWLATSVLFAAAMAWRDSEILAFFDFVAVAGAVAFAGIALGRPRMALFAERMRDTVVAVALLTGEIIVGVIPLALRDALGPATTGHTSGRFATALRVGALSGALLLVFGALLRSADPLFASIVSVPDFDVPLVLSHLVVIAFFAAITAGWARGALLAGAAPARAPGAPLVRLGIPEVTGALGTLLVLFGAFVTVQFGWMFGGERFLLERTGITAATYARQGFFQMMWVVALVVPVLVATRAALDPSAGRPLRRRHTRLSVPIIALLAVMIASAVVRMRLYVHYFGLTTDRLYPIVVMGWLAFVLVWLARTVLRDWGRSFAAGVVISGLATLAALNVVAPDALVARVNLRRAERLPPTASHQLDIAYLATLGGDAVPLAARAIIAPPGAPASALAGADAGLDSQRCVAAGALLRRFGPTAPAALELDEDAAWRFWNADRAAAVRAVGANARALRQVQHETCGRVRARERAAATPASQG